MPSKHNKHMQMAKMEVAQEPMEFLAKQAYNMAQMASQ